MAGKFHGASMENIARDGSCEEDVRRWSLIFNAHQNTQKRCLSIDRGMHALVSNRQPRRKTKICGGAARAKRDEGPIAFYIRGIKMFTE